MIIDSDAGVDDALAILMAVRHADTQVEAITTVSGNVGVEKTTANVLKVLDAVNADVPVYKGCALPLIPSAEDASEIHGSDGLGDCGIPASERRPEEGHAVHALIDLANANSGELSLAAIGPLTNIAAATMLDPSLPEKLKEITIMGGAVTGKGNTNGTAEFNIYFDPEAARIVFSRWPKVRVVDWEVAAAFPLHKGEVAGLDALNTPLSRFVERINRHERAFIKENYGSEDSIHSDGLAMAAALDDAIITRRENRYLQVELRGEATRGMTVVDWQGSTGKPANAEIVLGIDKRRYLDLLTETLG